MDSKMKKNAIVFCTLAVLMVLSVVLVINWKSIVPAGTDPKAAQAGQEMGAQETTVYQSGQIGDNLRGFLNDDTFFDQEKNYYSEIYSEMDRLSLVVTSVEKDLRIQVVDVEGKLVTGQSFFVSVGDLGEFKDLDQDGIIYVADLEPGEYNVSLEPIEGFSVSANSTRIRVKERVEYVAIDDISLLIKTEEEIDAKAEDTGIKDATADTDGTESSTHASLTGTAKMGIDVSKWNKEIDWDKVKADGVNFAMIRVGYRGSFTGALVEDPYFEQNIKGALAAGVQVGIYFFTQATNEVEAVEEASMVIALCSGYDITYPVVIDTEGAGGNGRADGLDGEMRTAVCKAFCQTIQNAGYEAGVYASRNWMNNNLDMSQLDSYKVWLAEYRSTPLYQGYYDMWQYTSKGAVDGISGRVDLNISYLGY